MEVFALKGKFILTGLLERHLCLHKKGPTKNEVIDSHPVGIYYFSYLLTRKAATSANRDANPHSLSYQVATERISPCN
jgi:hypothetical protein